MHQSQKREAQMFHTTTTTTPITTHSKACSSTAVVVVAVVASSSSAVAEPHGFRIAGTPAPLFSPPPLLLLCTLALLLLAQMPAACLAVGYSYSRFEGPVAGPEHKIYVPDVYGVGMRADYVARPEYSFAYGVEDGKTRVLQNRKETRDGDEVKGVYSVVDPDGTLRVVKYTADDVHGFQAEVITNGVATIHGHGDGGDIIFGGANAQQLQHHNAAAAAADNDDDDGRHDNRAQYQVHEEHDEADKEDEAEHTDADDDDDGDEHEQYDGSSEEGYEEAERQSQEAEAEAEEYETSSENDDY